MAEVGEICFIILHIHLVIDVNRFYLIVALIPEFVVVLFTFP